MTSRLGCFDTNNPPTDRTHTEHLVELLWVGAVPAEKV